MLDIIRRNSQSVGVKVVFALIIIVFVFWGASSMNAGSPNVLAKVNGQPINSAEFITLFRYEMAMLQRNNPQLAALAEKEREALGRELLQRMVSRAAMRAEAEKMGIFVSDLELSKRVTSSPLFQNAEGKFEQERYNNFLRQTGMKASIYENTLADAILFEKLQSYFAGAVNISEDAARQVYNYEAEERIIEYVPFNAATYTHDVAPTDDEIAAYYESNKLVFKLTAQADLDFINISIKDLTAGKVVSEAQVAEYYQNNPDRFTEPKRFDASHILFLAPFGTAPTDSAVVEAEEKAKAAIKRLQNGEKFDVVARAVSDDAQTAPNGGALGWFKSGAVEPTFEAAALALKKGEFTTEPVRTYFGFHVILLNDVEESNLRPLAEVKEAVETTLRQEDGYKVMTEVMPKVEAEIGAGKSLESVAEEYKVQVENTSLVPYELLPTLLKVSSDSFGGFDASMIGSVLPEGILTDDGFMLVRVKDFKPEHVQELASVKEKIIEVLKEQGGHKLALEAANKLAGEIAANDAKLPAAYADKKQLSAAGNRMGGGGFAAIGFSPSLNEFVFSTAKDSWSTEGISTGTGAIVARVKDILPASETNWDDQKAAYVEALNRNRQGELLGAFFITAEKNAKIEYYTQNPLAQPQ